MHYLLKLNKYLLSYDPKWVMLRDTHAYIYQEKWSRNIHRNIYFKYFKLKINQNAYQQWDG